MKKFKFKLKPLLRYRSFQEHQKQLEVAAAHNEVKACESRIAAMQRASMSTGDARDAILSDGMDAARLQWFNNHIQGLSSLRVFELSRRIELEEALTRKQQELSEKAAARKAVENLEKRQREAYYREALRVEQRGVDDLVVLSKKRF
jgi:flagellar export protein FliJ